MPNKLRVPRLTWRGTFVAFAGMAVLAGASAAASVGGVPGHDPRASAAPIGVSGSAALAERHGRTVRDVAPAETAQRLALAPVVGDTEWLWAFDFQRHAYYPVRAILQSKTASSWIYLQEGLELPPGTIEELRSAFDETVLPAVREALGAEPSPGIDAEPAITVLLLDIRDPLYYQVPPGTYFTGYFDPVNLRRQADIDDEDPRLKSNEREMLYVDVGWPTDPSSAEPKQTLAHELAHLVQWSYDPQEQDWMVEGLSELAVHLSGLGHPRQHVLAFLADPDIALRRWDGNAGDYGKSYMFFLYAFEQTGEDRAWLRTLVADPRQGMDSLAAVYPIPRAPPELLRDLVLALQLDDPRIADGRFAIRSMDVGEPAADAEYPRPRRSPRPLRDAERLAYEYEPWSARLHAFDSGDLDLELELRPLTSLCVGSTRVPASPGARVEIGCLSGGEPSLVLIDAAPRGVRESSAVLVVANGSDLPSALDLRAVPKSGASSLRGRILLPIASARH